MEVKHIGIFGKRNVGKSSLINTLIGEDVAIVSSEAGTTTDPVKKRMEIFGVGPIQLIDTAGLDDTGVLGKQRVKKSKDIFSQIDMALLLFTGNVFSKEEKEALKEFKKYNIPVLLIHNQSDIISLDSELALELTNNFGVDVLEFSCCMLNEQEQKNAVDSLIALIVKNISKNEKSILHGLVNEGDKVVLVCPIDKGAPTERLILPQVMAIRDILDNKAISIVMQPCNLESYLINNTPSLVITDSQVFKEVATLVPKNIPMTSFSILLARSKGSFNEYIIGAKQISKLQGGDEVLILESCTHHKSCDDIGRVKIPKMLQKFVNDIKVANIGGGESSHACELKFTFVSGLDNIPNKKYALAIQCGGCMVTTKQLNNRVQELIEKGIKVTNYGMAIAYVNGIFDRAIR
ncbi:MAG: [FeFe] hydrogenase H-cluster maturation GTPase HydF [Bacteroidales bacterium]